MKRIGPLLVATYTRTRPMTPEAFTRLTSKSASDVAG
jgi:hypothetical protein